MAQAATKPLIVAALGSRGTGKSAWVRQYLYRMKPARLAIWDYMDEHDWAGPAVHDLGAAIRLMASARFVVRFVPSHDDDVKALQFEKWCRACMVAGNLTAYVEELAFVTTAHKAPPGWRAMCLLGRHHRHRVSIIGTSQRPNQVDKEFLSNADLIHCGRLGNGMDAKAAAEVLAVHYSEVQRLPDLAYIERATGDIDPTRGLLSFAVKRARKPPPKGAAT